ncbi:hypothetical protein O181_078161 [Austropuccinia psidii MF-1]|uniref:Uncharacterized protein n=1 Tax=Austropuccinia psidii MF-1 TaxID=1389203 RepID=A0A9Q3FJH2_9BASI|nr:hypothetical protein [Austropuccinia psidii MF-1]
MDPGPPLICGYSKEEVHSETRCTHLAEDLGRRIFRTQGASCHIPNYRRVTIEGDESSKDIVRTFAKEHSELNEKIMEKPTFKPKPEEEVSPLKRNKKINKIQWKIVNIVEIGNHIPFSQPMTPLNHKLD